MGISTCPLDSFGAAGCRHHVVICVGKKNMISRLSACMGCGSELLPAGTLYIYGCVELPVGSCELRKYGVYVGHGLCVWILQESSPNLVACVSSIL